MVRSLSLTSVRVATEPPGRHVAHLYAEKLKMIKQDINCRLLKVGSEVFITSGCQHKFGVSSQYC